MRNLVFCALLLSMTVFAQDRYDQSAAVAYQNQLDKEFADPKESPLPESELKAFGGLDFFPVDPNYIIEADFIRTDNEKPFGMKTTGSRRPMYVKFGEAHFTIDGKPYKLNIYRNIELSKKPAYQDHLFLPFSDLTSGNESYIGGRYIDLKIPASGKIIIDFNRAYNPYCAYNHKYSCPIVPLENDLPVAIRAGVKKFHD